MKPSSQIKARAKELEEESPFVELEGKPEDKFYNFFAKSIMRNAAYNEAILEWIDKQHKEERHFQNCRMGIRCTRCNPQEDE